MIQRVMAMAASRQSKAAHQRPARIGSTPASAVAQDGGDIVYRGYKDGTLYLAMQGACSGCPSSAVTLKRGVESLIKHYVPEVETIEAV